MNARSNSAFALGRRHLLGIEGLFKPRCRGRRRAGPGI